MTTLEPPPRLVVCTVSLEPKSRAGLAERLQATYPHVLAPRGAAGPTIFADQGRRWAVWFSPSAIGLETNRFLDFGELWKRLHDVLRWVEAGPFLRVGLRSVFRVPSSWTTAPRSPLPEKQHLGQVIRWSAHGGQAFLDLDVFAENLQFAGLHAHLEEIFLTCRQLSPGAVDFGTESTVFSVEAPAPVLRRTHETTVVQAFLELLPFRPEPSLEEVAGERSELLARKYGEGNLSAGEQERLAALTARLEQLLPPVSVQDLENLHAMATEADRLLQRARQRRERLGLN
ncbi:MAG: hypothetical protein WAM82_10535 [Thermoanaerobaculia bacterium]